MVSLVAGAVFLGVAGSWALARVDLLSGLRDWILPALLIAVGLIGLVGIRPRRRDTQDLTGGTDWTVGHPEENNP